jgi:hypothetical protein
MKAGCPHPAAGKWELESGNWVLELRRVGARGLQRVNCAAWGHAAFRGGTAPRGGTRPSEGELRRVGARGLQRGVRGFQFQAGSAVHVRPLEAGEGLGHGRDPRA